MLQQDPNVDWQQVEVLRNSLMALLQLQGASNDSIANMTLQEFETADDTNIMDTHFVVKVRRVKNLKCFMTTHSGHFFP